MIYKRLLLVSSAFLLTLGFSGCGQSNSENSDEIQWTVSERTGKASWNGQQSGCDQDHWSYGRCRIYRNGSGEKTL